MTSPPLPPKKSFRIKAIQKNGSKPKWGAHVPPSPPLGHATDQTFIIVEPAITKGQTKQAVQLLQVFF